MFVLLEVRISFISFLKISRSREEDCGEMEPLILLVSVSDRVKARIKLRDSPSSSLSSSSSKSIIRLTVASLLGMPIFFKRLVTEWSLFLSNAPELCSFWINVVSSKRFGLSQILWVLVTWSPFDSVSSLANNFFCSLPSTVSFFFIEISKGMENVSPACDCIDFERESCSASCADAGSCVLDLGGASSTFPVAPIELTASRRAKFASRRSSDASIETTEIISSLRGWFDESLPFHLELHSANCTLLDCNSSFLKSLVDASPWIPELLWLSILSTNNVLVPCIFVGGENIWSSPSFRKSFAGTTSNSALSFLSPQSPSNICDSSITTSTLPTIGLVMTVVSEEMLRCFFSVWISLPRTTGRDAALSNAVAE